MDRLKSCSCISRYAAACHRVHVFSVFVVIITLSKDDLAAALLRIASSSATGAGDASIHATLAHYPHVHAGIEHVTAAITDAPRIVGMDTIASPRPVAAVSCAVDAAASAPPFKKNRIQKESKMDFSRYRTRYVALHVMYLGHKYYGLASQSSVTETIEVFVLLHLHDFAVVCFFNVRFIPSCCITAWVGHFFMLLQPTFVVSCEVCFVHGVAQTVVKAHIHHLRVYSRQCIFISPFCSFPGDLMTRYRIARRHTCLMR